MRRSPPINNLRGSNDGTTGVSHGVHHDLHFDGVTPPAGQYSSAANYSQGIPGQWPTNPPPAQQPRLPQQPPPQWAPPLPPRSQSNTRNDSATQWIPDGDFLDMPEPGSTPIPPALPPRQDPQPYLWNANDDPRRPSRQQSPSYRPLDTLPASLLAGLSRYDAAPPPPIPPKTPIPQYNHYSASPPPIPPHDHDPYQENRRRYSLTPPRQSPSPNLSVQSEPTYYPGPAHPSNPVRPPTGARLSPDMHYNSLPQRPSSHSGITNEVPLFIPRNQRPPTAHSYNSNEITPPRQDRYSPRPSPPQNLQDFPPTRFNPQSQPVQYQYPPQQQQPQIEPYRRLSHSPPRQQTPPQQPLWRPTPPPQKRPAGPITSTPPPNSLVNLRHLPYQPILQPPYHRETLDHPQHFAKSHLIKINVIPAENTTFLAGGEIFGRMDISCKGEGGSKGKPELLIGELGIELIAYDGIPLNTTRGNSRIQGRFLTTSVTYFSTFKKNFSISL